MFDADYYEGLRGRVTALLIGVERALQPDQRTVLADLIDHNEPGVAVEMIVAMLAEGTASITVDQIAQVERLVRDMGLDESVSRQAREMIQR
jgi:transcription initiation factor TFIIIB Brf1 subunit/transcription initiation factor TFIIB